MDYMKLISGIVLLAVFTWILVRTSKRTGSLHMLTRMDTIVGVIAGLYLVITSVKSLF
jgi:hypothetical protein